MGEQHCADVGVVVCLLPAADEEFDQLCFEYGIELDDVVSSRTQGVHSAAQRTRMQLAEQLYTQLYSLAAWGWTQQGLCWFAVCKGSRAVWIWN